MLIAPMLAAETKPLSRSERKQLTAKLTDRYRQFILDVEPILTTVNLTTEQAGAELRVDRVDGDVGRAVAAEHAEGVQVDLPPFDQWTVPPTEKRGVRS